MFTLFLVGFICLVAGFGLGRIKNAGKLAAIKKELDSIQAGGTVLATTIRQHL